jgi:hypothetical protein
MTVGSIRLVVPEGEMHLEVLAIICVIIPTSTALRASRRL